MAEWSNPPILNLYINSFKLRLDHSGSQPFNCYVHNVVLSPCVKVVMVRLVTLCLRGRVCLWRVVSLLFAVDQSLADLTRSEFTYSG